MRGKRVGRLRTPTAGAGFKRPPQGDLVEFTAEYLRERNLPELVSIMEGLGLPTDGFETAGEALTSLLNTAVDAN